MVCLVPAGLRRLLLPPPGRGEARTVLIRLGVRRRLLGIATVSSPPRSPQQSLSPGQVAWPRARFQNRAAVSPRNGAFTFLFLLHWLSIVPCSLITLALRQFVSIRPGTDVEPVCPRIRRHCHGTTKHY